jgi:hypothetical protein
MFVIKSCAFVFSETVPITETATYTNKKCQHVSAGINYIWIMIIVQAQG